MPDKATERVRQAARDYETAKIWLEQVRDQDVPPGVDGPIRWAEIRALADAEVSRTWRLLNDAKSEYAHLERG